MATEPLDPEEPEKKIPWHYPYGKRPGFFDRPGHTWSDSEYNLFATLFFAPYAKEVVGLECSDDPDPAEKSLNPNNKYIRHLAGGWLYGWSKTDVDTAVVDVACELVSTIRASFLPAKRPLESYFLYLFRQRIGGWADREAGRRKRFPCISIDSCEIDWDSDLSDSSNLSFILDEYEAAMAELRTKLSAVHLKTINRFMETFKAVRQNLPAGEHRAAYEATAAHLYGDEWKRMGDAQKKKVVQRLRTQLSRIIAIIRGFL